VAPVGKGRIKARSNEGPRGEERERKKGVGGKRGTVVRKGREPGKSGWGSSNIASTEVKCRGRISMG